MGVIFLLSYISSWCAGWSCVARSLPTDWFVWSGLCLCVWVCGCLLMLAVVFCFLFAAFLRLTFSLPAQRWWCAGDGMLLSCSGPCWLQVWGSGAAAPVQHCFQAPGEVLESLHFDLFLRCRWDGLALWTWWWAFHTCGSDNAGTWRRWSGRVLLGLLLLKYLYQLYLMRSLCCDAFLANN